MYVLLGRRVKVVEVRGGREGRSIESRFVRGAEFVMLRL